MTSEKDTGQVKTHTTLGHIINGAACVVRLSLTLFLRGPEITFFCLINSPRNHEKTFSD